MSTELQFTPLETEIFSRKSTENHLCAKLFGCFCFGFTLSTILFVSTYIVLHVLPSSNIPVPMELPADPENWGPVNLNFSAVGYKPCNRRLIGWTRLYEKNQMTNEQISSMTHIIFGPVTWHNYMRFRNSKEKRAFEVLKKKAELYGVKLLVSIDLRDYDAKEPTAFLKNSSTRWYPISGFSSFLHRNQIDGVEIFWNLPLTNTEISEIPSLLEEFRRYYNRFSSANGVSIVEKPLILSLAGPSFDIGLNFRSLRYNVDFFNIDAHNDSYSNSDEGSLESIFEYYVCRTKQPNKLNLKLDFGDGKNRQSLIQKMKYGIDQNIGGFVIKQSNEVDEKSTFSELMNFAKHCTENNTTNFDCSAY